MFSYARKEQKLTASCVQHEQVLKVQGRAVIWEGVVAQTQVCCDMQGLLYRRVGWPPMYLVGPMLAQIGRLEELWLGQSLPG